ncbi:hypothetical protein BVY03_02550 [bacterium K02(2017)]|nr:hypothetical protein BVY03_02550 [bacterium K02(2017)]
MSVGYSYYHLVLSYDFKITHIDVRQGDAILLQSHTKNILVDTGGSAYVDVGKRSLIPYLKQQWISQIDVLVITHADIDHYGGARSVLEKIAVKQVWFADNVVEDKNYQSLIDFINSKKIPIKRVEDGGEFVISERFKIKVLAPLKIEGRSFDDNDSSVVLKVEFDQFAALLTGDISEELEGYLIKRYRSELKADYLKVAHHGSRTSSSMQFLKIVRPNFASIGVDENSRFGHPHQVVLNRINEMGTKLLRTDLNGASGVILNEGKLSWFCYMENCL